MCIVLTDKETAQPDRVLSLSCAVFMFMSVALCLRIAASSVLRHHYLFYDNSVCSYGAVLQLRLEYVNAFLGRY